MRRLPAFARLMTRISPQPFLQAAEASPRLSLAELLRLHGEDSTAVLLLVLSVLCVVPIYGMGTALSLAILVLALHWLRLGESSPRVRAGSVLPGRLGAIRLDERWSRRCLHGLAWLYTHAGARLRARWTALCHRHTRAWWSAWIAAMAFIIFLPLPLGNVLPALSLVLMCLGWMFRDGVALLGSTLVGGAAIAYTWAFGHLVWQVVETASRWFARLPACC
jgi:hypothetical protein